MKGVSQKGHLITESLETCAWLQAQEKASMAPGSDTGPGFGAGGCWRVLGDFLWVSHSICRAASGFSDLWAAAGVSSSLLSDLGLPRSEE